MESPARASWGQSLGEEDVWGQENTRQGNAAALGKVCFFFFLLLLLLGFFVLFFFFFSEGAWERKRLFGADLDGSRPLVWGDNQAQPLCSSESQPGPAGKRPTAAGQLQGDQGPPAPKPTTLGTEEGVHEGCGGLPAGSPSIATPRLLPPGRLRAMSPPQPCPLGAI